MKTNDLKEKRKKKSNSPEKRERIAKNKLSQTKPGQGMAAKLMHDFQLKGTDPKRLDKEQKRKEIKKMRRKDNIMDDKNLNEGVLGMTNVPGISRMRELAGLPKLSTNLDELTEQWIELLSRLETLSEHDRVKFNESISKSGIVGIPLWMLPVNEESKEADDEEDEE